MLLEGHRDEKCRLQAKEIESKDGNVAATQTRTGPSPCGVQRNQKNLKIHNFDGFYPKAPAQRLESSAPTVANSIVLQLFMKVRNLLNLQDAPPNWCPTTRKPFTPLAMTQTACLMRNIYTP